MKRKVRLTESQLVNIIKKTISDVLYEQGPIGAPTYNTIKDLNAVLSKLDTHTKLEIISAMSAFIPFVGPFISSGIMLGDSALYYKNGDNESAALSASFALLPGIGGVLAKRIPGIINLGVRGMNDLAKKIILGSKLTNTELQVAKGISQNRNIVKDLLNKTMKEMAEKALQKTKNNNDDVDNKSRQKLLTLLKTNNAPKSTAQNFS